MKRILVIGEPSVFQCALGNSLREKYLLIASPSGAPADALILDLSTAGADGLAFLTRNRALLPAVVLVLSHLISPHVLQQLSQLNVGAVIRIPCTVNEVVRVLEDLFLTQEFKPYA